MRRHYLLSKERDLPPLVTAQCCQLNKRGKRRTWGNRKIQSHSETVGALLWHRRIPGNKRNTSALSPSLLAVSCCHCTVICLSLTGREARTKCLMLASDYSIPYVCKGAASCSCILGSYYWEFNPQSKGILVVWVDFATRKPQFSSRSNLEVIQPQITALQKSAEEV